jgi:hypothetical protein
VRTATLLPAGAVAALVGLAATAGAASAPKPVTTADAKGDVHSTLDLTRVAVGRGVDGRLRASLTLAAAWEPKDLVAKSGPPGSICVKVWTVNVPPDAVPDYLVCATTDADGALRGSVLHDRANRLPERVSGAAVSRPSGRTVTLRFSQSAIGRPAKLAAQGETTRPGCPRVSCIDTAPDAPKTLALTLSSSG